MGTQSTWGLISRVSSRTYRKTTTKMPRGSRSGGGGLFGGGARSAPAPSRQASTSAAPPPPAKTAPPPAATPPPAAAAPPPAAAAAPSSGGGMMSGMGGMMMQGAALGAGAAVGSSMVHGAMNMLSGSSDEKAAPAAQPVAYQQQPCANELQQFMNCSQSQPDLSLCQAFNDVYMQCKQANQ